MTRVRQSVRWLPNFCRALGFLRPHRRPLTLGLLAALGVSVFYTFSFTSVIPLLKVIFADHETLVDWLQRVEAERRLGVVVPADVPEDPAGLLIERVRPNSPVADVLHDGSRIVSIGGQSPGLYALLRTLATYEGVRLERVGVQDAAGATRAVALTLKPYRSWWNRARAVAALLPMGQSRQERIYTLGLVMGVLVAVTLLSAVFRFVNEGLVAVAVQRAMHDIRSRMADHVLRLPLVWHSTQPAGDTLGRFANDVARVEVGVWTLFGKTIREPLKAVGVFVLTILIDWRILLVSLVGMPLAILVIRVFGVLVKRAQRRASQSWGRLLDHLDERLAGIRIVKAYNMQDAESRRFEHEDRTLTRAQTHIEVADAATKPALELLAMLAVAAFVLYGGTRVFRQQLEPHLFFAAVVCLAGMLEPVRKMGNVMNRVQVAEAAATRVFELIDLPPEASPIDRPGAVTLPPLRETIEFRDVAFAYPSNPGRLVLDGIDLAVEKGQVVALVGPNGSGKTTLISLLLHFYEPTRGQIRIDGQDIADGTLESLRRQIGLVTQDAVIFTDTVRANIAYGADGASEEAIRSAARRAHVDEFIQTLHVEHDGRVTNGYDAVISAETLSGGQRQRIALARAILRDPPVLILDEATSQVDSESERKIQQALEDVTSGRTTFIIAHRFSTIARADVTVVLNEGRIVAVGRHAELLETSPFYVTLCETQFAHGT